MEKVTDRALKICILSEPLDELSTWKLRRQDENEARMLAAQYEDQKEVRPWRR
jgi:hypothetical protein